VLLGVLLEPLKSWFALRAQNRRDLVQKCAEVVSLAHTCERGIVKMNFAHRSGLWSDQVREEAKSFNDARRELGVAVALLNLWGPDELAQSADEVEEAIAAMFELMQTPTDPGKGKRDLPVAITKAETGVHNALTGFTQAARPFTRAGRQ
jgi:hypothetical protein